MPGSKLLARILDISEKAKMPSVAVAIHDFQTELGFSYQADKWFHAASTFKAGILFALLKAADQKRVRLDDHLQIRNRFFSITDGSVYRIDRERDGDSVVHRHIGKSMSLLNLAQAMIVRSSNLATNLLLDFLSLDYVRHCLKQANVEGLEIRRGVEDMAAHESGINNETTANGLLRLFRTFLDDAALTVESRKHALQILLAQEFNGMIPAQLPDAVLVAHKTGEISTHCHDAGIVFVENRQPYVVAIMSETSPETTHRAKAIAKISAAIFDYVLGTRGDGEKA